MVQYCFPVAADFQPGAVKSALKWLCFAKSVGLFFSKMESGLLRATWSVEVCFMKTGSESVWGKKHTFGVVMYSKKFQTADVPTIEKKKSEV